MDINKIDTIQSTALATSKLLAKNDIEDTTNVISNATESLAYEINRQMLMARAVVAIERGIGKMNTYVKWAPVKFAVLSAIFSMIFTIGYYYYKFDFLNALDKWGIIGHILFGAIIGGYIANTFDLAILESVINLLINRTPKYTLTLDFYSNFKISEIGEGGEWMSVQTIQEEILKLTKREYSRPEIADFMNSEPYFRKRQENRIKEYFIERQHVEF